LDTSHFKANHSALIKWIRLTNLVDQPKELLKVMYHTEETPLFIYISLAIEDK
jgi:hypothetical protein